MIQDEYESTRQHSIKNDEVQGGYWMARAHVQGRGPIWLARLVSAGRERSRQFGSESVAVDRLARCLG